jgi:hypothetical protein
VKKPSFKWPLVSLVFAVYVFGAAFVDSFIDVEEDQAEALGALVASMFWISCTLAVIHVRVNRLDEWKRERRLEWLKRDLPPPEVPDWEAVEREAEKKARNE